MFNKILKYNRVRRVGPRWNVPIAQYGVKLDQPNIEIGNPDNNLNHQSKTVTEIFDAALKEAKTKPRKSSEPSENKSMQLVDTGMGAPHIADYTPRFEYNGYLKKCSWIPFVENQKPKQFVKSSRSERREYAKLSKSKVCLLMGFAGQNYSGMEYNGRGIETIEKYLFEALLTNRWILPEHIFKIGTVEFEHGSRTDAGVSAARMNCSIILPNEINIEDINKELPADIRVFGMKTVPRNFNARFSCSARTYSYTLPSISFSRYDDQTELHDYRITADRLQLADDILLRYVGENNYHNYTSKKQYFDPSVVRSVHSIEIDEPFIEGDIEFCRVLIKGQSFILHQIRKIIGTSLAVLRDIIDVDYIHRSFTQEKLKTPLAPGLGLMLERLHFTQHASLYQNRDPLDFNEFNDAVEEFRRTQIHPIIVEKELKENVMSKWLELLCVHDYEFETRRDKPELWSDTTPNNEWGESPEFIAKLKALEMEGK